MRDAIGAYSDSGSTVETIIAGDILSEINSQVRKFFVSFHACKKLHLTNLGGI